MASDSRIDRILHLFNKFNTFLTAPVPDLFLIFSNHKKYFEKHHCMGAGSIGALAIAIVFTWKFLRSPVGCQRRHQKWRGLSTGNQGNEIATRTEESQLLVPMDHAASEESHSPVKLSLGEIVKKKLNGGRKMTCRLLGVILEESAPEELQKHATVRPSVLEALLMITKYCDVYLMERVLDDESAVDSFTFSHDYAYIPCFVLKGIPSLS